MKLSAKLASAAIAVAVMAGASVVSTTPASAKCHKHHHHYGWSGRHHRHYARHYFPVSTVNTGGAAVVATDRAGDEVLFEPVSSATGFVTPLLNGAFNVVTLNSGGALSSTPSAPAAAAVVGEAEVINRKGKVVATDVVVAPVPKGDKLCRIKQAAYDDFGHFLGYQYVEMICAH